MLAYFVDLQSARAQASQGEVFLRGDQTTFLATLDPTQRLEQWSPQPSWSPPGDLDLRWLGACAWSEELAVATVQFLQECYWPLDTGEPTTNVVGISWLEIAIGIMFYFKEYIPIRRVTASGNLELVRLPNLQAAQIHGATLPEMANNVSLLFTQLKALVPSELFPPLNRTRVKSLYLLGHNQFSQGLQQRPRMAYQVAIITTTKLFLSSQKLPDFGFAGAEQHFDISDWNLRAQMAKSAVAQVRSLGVSP